MTATDAASSIISLLIDEVRQSLEPKILHILADYQTYKETHDAVLQIPFVKHLLENQCRCRHPLPDAAPEAINDDQIHLEIIDVAAHGLPNLDSIAEYINSTIDKDDKVSSEAEEAEAEAEDSEEEEEEEAEDSEEEEAVSEAEEEEAVSEAEEAVSEAEEAVSEAEEAVSEAEEAEAEAEESEAQEVTNESAEAEAEAEVVAQKKAPGAAETSEAAISEAAISEAAISEAAISEAAISEAAISEAAEDDEEELELFEVEIKGKTYVTNDEIEGDIYEYANDEVGEIVGTFKNGVAKFAKKPKAAQKK